MVRTIPHPPNPRCVVTIGLIYDHFFRRSISTPKSFEAAMLAYFRHVLRGIQYITDDTELKIVDSVMMVSTRQVAERRDGDGIKIRAPRQNKVVHVQHLTHETTRKCRTY